jgi:hypothetical protein
MTKFNNIADRTILPAKNGKLQKFRDGDTFDIIQVILETSHIARQDTAQFARYLIGSHLMETLRNDYDFVLNNIEYKVDEPGFQYIKTPARAWADKIADCKSFSIFLGSLLENQGIPYMFRFVSFRKDDPTKTHVYVVVPWKGQNSVIMDIVTKKFNYEKPYQFKEDKMTKIYQMSGIGAAPAKPMEISINLGNKDIKDMTDGEMTAWIARDRLITEKNIVEQIQGIGSLTSEKYQDSIDMINDTLGAIHAYSIGAIDDIDVELGLIASDAVNGKYSVASEISGIGSIKGRINARKSLQGQRREGRKFIKQRLTPEEKKNIWARPTRKGAVGSTITGNFLKKIAKGVKKAAKTVAKVAVKVTKAVTKVALLPMTLPIKAMLEIQLPKAAPFFLYLFINDKKIIDKLPEKVRKKRKKAEFIANFIVNAIGMKREHLMGILRNGIMKQYKKSPENVIAEEMKKRNIAGIGIVPIIAGAIAAIVKIIPAIIKLFKKKKTAETDVSAADAPDATDWGGLADTAATALTSSIKNQPENTSVLNQAPVTTKTGMTNAKSIKLKAAQTKSAQPDVTDVTENFESGGRSIWDSLK